MKNKKIGFIALLALVVVLLTGAFFVALLSIVNANEQSMAEENVDIASFSAYTDVEEFQNVPAMVVQGTSIGDAEDYGNGTYLLGVSGTTEQNYEDYLATLEQAGYKKHSDNGEDKMEGYARTASYTKDDITVTVSHAITIDKTYISATKNGTLSEHLIYKDEYVADNVEGAQTELYLVELYESGNSYIIKLKNGHFIVHDGGYEVEGQYLVDLLESLTDGDQKPVIEAWFISHAHEDHHGAMVNIAMDSKLSSRLIVQGVYFNTPSPSFLATSDVSPVTVQTVTTAARTFDNGEGGKSPLYRPQFGQRYYFNDIVIDVSLTPEQYATSTYYTADFNDTSIWLKHFIEGQIFFLGGDSAHTGARTMINMFDKSYADVDIFSVLHHGINVYNYFTDFVKAETVLYTNWRFGSVYQNNTNVVSARLEENAKLQASAKECYHYGDGTVKLSFPYAVGTAEILPENPWKYHVGDHVKTYPTNEGTATLIMD